VSCLMAVDDFWYPGGCQERQSATKWQHIFHIVRHPLPTISSMVAMNRPHFWHWTQLHTGLRVEKYSAVEHAARFWVRWNELVEKLAPEWRFRVEDDFWPEMCHRLMMNPRIRPEASRFRSAHSELDWNDLGGVAEPVRAMAASYGYPVN